MAGINADDDGFLIGERRHREMMQNIEEARNNTSALITTLLAGVQAAIEAEGTRLENALNRIANDASANPNNTGNNSNPNDPSPIGPPRPSNDAEGTPPQPDQSGSGSPGSRRQPRPPRQSNIPHSGDQSTQDAEEEDNSNNASSRAARARERERDSRGRFIGAGNAADEKSLLGKLKSLFGDVNADGVDTGGIDPTIDALHELKQTLGPVGNVFSKMTGRAVSLFAGRIKKRRNEETLPEEQQQANRREERNDRERNRLLKRMLDALLRRNGGNGPDIDLGLGGGNGGRRDRRRRRRRAGGRGRGLAGLGKFAKGIPFAGGAIAAALALSDWGDQNFQERSSTVGSLAGGAIGGGIGLIGGPIGAAVGVAIGSWAGEKLGGIVAPTIEPYFEKWTDSLIKADVPNLLKTSWDDFTKLVGKAFGITPAGLAIGAASTIGSWGKGLWDRVTGERNGKYVLQQQYGGLGLNGAGAVPYNGNGSGVGESTKKKQLAVYEAFKKAGFNDNWAAAYTASVGRENDYNDRYLYGKHNDKAGGVNMGMISWQGDRQKKLYEFMKKRGLIDTRGNIIKGQASLDAQAEFKKWEIDNDPTFKGIKDYIAKNPNASKADAARALGTKDIKWAYGQKKLRNGESFNWEDHLQKEYDYRDSLDKAVTNEKIEVMKPKAQSQVPYANKSPTQTSAVKVTGAERRPQIKVPAITPEISKVGSKQQALVVNQQQSDSFIGQDVSVRSLAHTISGGLGYNRNLG